VAFRSATAASGSFQGHASLTRWVTVRNGGAGEQFRLGRADGAGRGDVTMRTRARGAPWPLSPGSLELCPSRLGTQSEARRLPGMARKPRALVDPPPCWEWVRVEWNPERTRPVQPSTRESRRPPPAGACTHGAHPPTPETTARGTAAGRRSPGAPQVHRPCYRIVIAIDRRAGPQRLSVTFLIPFFAR
jgi:hypothetical protein